MQILTQIGKKRYISWTINKGDDDFYKFLGGNNANWMVYEDS